jgi:hypothetical protein
MRNRRARAWLLCAAFVLSGAGLSACATVVPPNRLADYVGHQAMRETPPDVTLPDRRPLKAGLLLVGDTTAPDASPTLPDQALIQMSEQLQQQFSQFLPLSIEKIIPAEGIRPGSDAARFVELGRKYGLDYLVLVIASATEVEYPIYVAVGGTTNVVPGLRRDNWSLVEVALLDVRNRQVLVHAEGRGWATLDRATTPDVNQWYPVIWKRPLEPNWRWWPPTYESAPHTLRVIAMHEAVKRLVINFQDAWLRKREADFAALRG